jgi:hypothetical protein
MTRGDAAPEATPGHGKLTNDIPVIYSRHSVPPARAGDGPKPLPTLNVMWHGRERDVDRIPPHNPDPPLVAWKMQRKRMEWTPQGIGQSVSEPNSKGSEAFVKYKSSLLSTGRKMTKGAAVVVNGKLYVNLMDEMYKMTPYNAHYSVGEAGKVVDGEKRGVVGEVGRVAEPGGNQVRWGVVVVCVECMCCMCCP